MEHMTHDPNEWRKSSVPSPLRTPHTGELPPVIRAALEHPIPVADTIASLESRIRELESELASRSIHSHHKNCNHPMCVLRRRVKELEAALATAGERMRERAAKVADSFDDGPAYETRCATAYQIACQIRSLPIEENPQ